jgi:hypothetical protein
MLTVTESQACAAPGTKSIATSRGGDRQEPAAEKAELVERRDPSSALPAKQGRWGAIGHLPHTLWLLYG